MFDSITKLSMPQCITSAINSFTSLWLCRKVSTSLGNLYHLAKNVISRLVGDKLTFSKLPAGRLEFDVPLRSLITNPMPIVSISQSLTTRSEEMESCEVLEEKQDDDDLEDPTDFVVNLSGLSAVSDVSDVAGVAGVIVASAPKFNFRCWVLKLAEEAKKSSQIMEKLESPPLRHDQLKTDLKGLVSEIANQINVPIKGEQREKLIKQVTNSFFARRR